MSDTPVYEVRIFRWDIYRVQNVVAKSDVEGEEQALEIFQQRECEHIDGGLDHCEAVRVED